MGDMCRVLVKFNLSFCWWILGTNVFLVFYSVNDRVARLNRVTIMVYDRYSMVYVMIWIASEVGH